MRKRSVLGATLVVTLVLSGCGLFTDEETVTVAAAQEQFCSDVEQYVTAIGEYGGLFQDVELTVGDVKSAQDELEPAREAVIDSGNAFQEAVNSDPTAGVSIDLVEPESIEAVEEAEDAFADASEIDDDTPFLDAGVYFTSAAYQLEVAWTRLFADAGCVEDEDEAQAKQWVSDYVTAMQTDLSTVGYYEGKIDGIYGPMTIAAVEDLQRDSGLPVTGLLDPASQTVLQGLLGQRESAQVGALQGILISTGYYTGPVDGQWSRQVEDALKALQTDLGVPATGEVDAATLRAFEQALTEAGQPPVTAPTQPGAATTVPPETPTTAPVAPTSTAAPATTVPAEGTGILDVLAEAGQFTQLLAALDAAGLTETLTGPGPFTLFAPTDEAFEQMDALPTDPDDLAALLLYHLVEDELTGFEIQATPSLTTAQGTDIAVTVDLGQIILNGSSTVTVSNVTASNGIAHVVNSVLLPTG
jgi:uncharacterized surface protein with fasciclin (FAS1) repeats